MQQARGKWMIPAYKAVLFTSFGCSMYMMGRLVLVRRLHISQSPELTVRRDTRPGSARTKLCAMISVEAAQGI
jgi:hypothetical protein